MLRKFFSSATEIYKSHETIVMSMVNKLIGHRKPLPNHPLNYVKVHCWGTSKVLPTKHTTLEIMYHGAVYYLSFSPLIRPTAKGSIFSKREGIKAEFKDSFDDELLIQGFRIKYCNDLEALELRNEATLKRIRQLEPEEQDLLRKMGKPTQTEELHCLNLEKMIVEVQWLKESESVRWAAWSATQTSQKDTFNCASIILHVLNRGGLGELVSSYHDALGLLSGMLLGVAAGMQGGALLTVTLDFLTGLFFGRVIGGAYEGASDAQSLIDIFANAKHEKGLKIIGLRIATTLFSAVSSVLKVGVILEELFCTTPQHVMERMQEAVRNESALYSCEYKQAM